MSVAVLPENRPWPFSTAELTAGLRRHTGDPTLRILALDEHDLLQRRPSVGRIRGVRVRARGSTGEYTFRMVLKEPQQSGTTLAGSIGPAMREAAFYRHLSTHLPVRTPHIYAMHPEGAWLLLEYLEDGRPPEGWRAAEYQRAVEQLLVLHDRFWGLGDDLAVYTWLGRPLDANLEVHLRVAEAAVSRLLETAPREMQQNPVPWEGLLSTLVGRAREIAAALCRLPFTLLHGDYWPGNIHIDSGGHITVYDWQRVSIGPGLLDVISLVQTSRWWFQELPLDESEILRRYRAGVERSSGQTWTDAEWHTLWGYGFLWVFLAHWLDVLASTPAPVLQTHAGQLTDLWLRPAADWLGVFFPEA